MAENSPSSSFRPDPSAPIGGEAEVLPRNPAVPPSQEIITALSRKVSELEAQLKALTTLRSRKLVGGDVGGEGMAAEVGAGIATDRAETAVDAAEFYRGLFEHLPIAAAVSDLETGTVLAANRAYAEEVQMERDQLLGKTAHELGFWMGDSVREEFVEALKRDGRTVRLDLRRHPVSGRDRQYHLRAARLPAPRQDAVVVGLIDRTLEHLFEQQVQASEKRYRSVVEELYDARIIHGPDFTVHDANERACALLGTSRADLSSRSWMSFLPDGEQARYAARLAQLDERPAQMFESKVRRPDGVEVEVEVSTLRIEAGSAAPTLVLLRDISARKQVEKMLLESERRFRQIADHVGDIFWIAALPAGEVQYVNLAFEEVFGRARSELYRDGKLWRACVAEDEGLDPFAVAEKGTFTQEYRIRRPDGSIRWLQTRSVVVRESSAKDAAPTTHLVGIATDVTAWKESMALVERVGLGLSARFGADFLQHLARELAAALQADYASIAELHPEREGWIQVVAEWPESRWSSRMPQPYAVGGAEAEAAEAAEAAEIPEAAGAAAKTAATDASRFKNTRSFALAGSVSAGVAAGSGYAHPRGLAVAFPQDMRAAALGAEGYVGAPLIDSQGAVLGLVEVMWRKPVEKAGAAESVLRIFASRASAELERLKAEAVAHLRQEQLREADKLASLDILSAGIAHEINNPNNLSMFNADLLAKIWSDALPALEAHAAREEGFRLAGLPFAEMRDEVGALIDGVRGGAERIRDIVSGLKDFARPELGRREEVVDLREVMRRTLVIAGNLLRQATDGFEWNPGSGRLPKVLGNPQQLEQVLINLLQNACDALPDRTRAVRVIEGFDAAHVWLKVQDEGEGMSAADLDRLHVPFFTTKRGRGGTGLGLPVCFNIVQAHQGQLRFESEPGKGTTATLLLPRLEGT